MFTQVPFASFRSTLDLRPRGPELSPELQLAERDKARQALATRAKDAAEARELLEMLGLWWTPEETERRQASVRRRQESREDAG